MGYYVVGSYPPGINTGSYPAKIKIPVLVIGPSPPLRIPRLANFFVACLESKKMMLSL